MKGKDLALVINPPSDKKTHEDKVKIWTAARRDRIPMLCGAGAALRAITSLQGREVEVRALQEYHS